MSILITNKPGSGTTTGAFAIKTANYTLTPTDDTIGTSASSTITITLPLAASSTGKTFTVINGTTFGNITILAASGSDNIESTPGVTDVTYVMPNIDDSVTVVSDGTNWIVTNSEIGVSALLIVSSNYTYTLADDTVELANPSNLTATLTAGVATPPGKKFTLISDVPSPNVATLVAAGSDMIGTPGANFASTYVLPSENSSVTVQWDGHNWIVVAVSGTTSVSAGGYFQSSRVTTDSSSITTTGSFITFSNSPALTFTPSVSGIYKVYCSIPLIVSSTGGAFTPTRVFNTSGSASLSAESQGGSGSSIPAGSEIINSNPQSVYTLVAGTSYTFDIQIMLNAPASAVCTGSSSSFYMFAENIG